MHPTTSFRLEIDTSRSLRLVQFARRTYAHESRQVAMEIGDLLFLVRVGQRAAETTRFHTLLNPLHVAEVLRQHRTPMFCRRLGVYPFGFRLLPLRKAFQRIGFKNTFVGVVTIGPDAVTEGEGNALQNRLIGEKAQARPASPITSGGISGQMTPRAASSALAEAIQWLMTSAAGVPSGSSSTSRFAALTSVSVEAA